MIHGANTTRKHRRAVTLCATVAGWLRIQNGLIWYYLVHDYFSVSGLDWGIIIGYTGRCLFCIVEKLLISSRSFLHQLSRRYALYPFECTDQVNLRTVTGLG